jgi:6-phosphogluconolactonase
MLRSFELRSFPLSTASAPQVRIASDPAGSAEQCADHIENLLRGTIASTGKATFAISGGNTPAPMFRKLAASGLDWSKIHIFWVDERCVPPTDKQSNFKSANESLLQPARIPEANIHRVLGELPPDEAAAKYIEDIKGSFVLKGDELPAFDIMHRGMGPDAHTASLFPGEPLISDTTHIAARVWVEKMKMDRVTLLPGVLRKAKHTVLQAVGPDKAEPLYEVLYGPEDIHQFPCQIAARNSDTAVWFIDREAAAKIQNR